MVIICRDYVGAFELGKFDDSFQYKTGPDPGFSAGGGRGPILGGGGVWPPTWALFSENVCENERIRSCRGRAPARPLDPPI